MRRRDQVRTLRLLVREALHADRSKVLEQLGVALDALNYVQGLLPGSEERDRESAETIRGCLAEARGPLQKAWETARRVGV